VLVSAEGHVLATGYNGVPPKYPHCSEVPAARCPAADVPSGQQLDGCRAIHAEANALVQCSEVRRISTCYSTASPCMSCAKMLLATSCVRLVFAHAYPDWEAVRALWQDREGAFGPFNTWEQRT